MLIFFLAQALVQPPCRSETVREAAEIVVRAMVTPDVACLRTLIQNPEVVFEGGALHPAIRESLNWRAKGFKSYLDIVQSGYFFDEAGNNQHMSVFIISRQYRKAYFTSKNAFKDSYYHKRYFVCNFEKIDGAWKLKTDFCLTESEMD